MPDVLILFFFCDISLTYSGMHTLIESYVTFPQLFLIKQLGTTGANSCGTYVHVLPGLELYANSLSWSCTSGLAVKKGMITLIACGMYTLTVLIRWVVRSIHWGMLLYACEAIRAVNWHSN